MKNSFEFKREVERQEFINEKYEVLENKPVRIFSWLAFSSIFVGLIVAIFTSIFDVDFSKNSSDLFFWSYAGITFVVPTIVAAIYAINLVKVINKTKSIELNDLEYKETLITSLNVAKKLLLEIEKWESQFKNIESNGNLVEKLNEMNASVDNISKDGPVLLNLKTNLVNYFEHVNKKIRLQEFGVRDFEIRIFRLRVELAIDEAEEILSDLK